MKLLSPLSLSLFLLCFASFGKLHAAEQSEVDTAVKKALEYLRNTQNQDGSWSKNAVTQSPNTSKLSQKGHSTMTSLAVMAFLSTGKVPGEGKDGERIERGIRYVLDQQKANGLIAESTDRGIEMYCHGIATLMLAETVGMTQGRFAEELRTKLVSAVNLILAAQRTTGPDIGGWRYQVTGQDADLSVTGWQVLALRAAKNVGCNVPEERIKLAVEYVRRCFDSGSNGFRYQSNGPVTAPCTGTGILAIELCGKEYHLCNEVLKAGEYILSSPIYTTRPHFFYGTYYTSQGMFQLGGDYWKRYRERLHEMLLKTQIQNQNGSWFGRGGWDDDNYGPVYCTSMAVLSLTVEYRYLPIYQRFEEPIEVEP